MACPLQLLALCLANLHQLLKHQGPKYQLANDFIICQVAMATLMGTARAALP